MCMPNISCYGGSTKPKIFGNFSYGPILVRYFFDCSLHCECSEKSSVGFSVLVPWHPHIMKEVQ